MKKGGRGDQLLGVDEGCVRVRVPGKCLCGACSTELVQGVKNAGSLGKRAMVEIQ